ncbi:hypothetical protein Y1Q_0017231 [Alligator mississippiensis]|uniref:Uncharacterized protein n=1 Tax=Alligator mississippiensis TaxID=8496 RepID=A0A151NKT6_ALLMI|nr:hypothetical protein Y1Q_0017231 [Alligator mississippiensis]
MPTCLSFLNGPPFDFYFCYSGPTSGCGGEAAGPSEDAGSGMPLPSIGALQMCQQHQKSMQDRTPLLQWLLMVSEEREQCTQAWWEEDLASQDRWWAEDIAWETTWEEAQNQCELLRAWKTGNRPSCLIKPIYLTWRGDKAEPERIRSSRCRWSHCSSQTSAPGQGTTLDHDWKFWIISSEEAVFSL